MSFKIFFTESKNNEDAKDIKDLIHRLPKSHQSLLKGYKFSSEDGNTLKGDSGHIGYNDLHNKKIAVAAPFHHSRSMAFCHEIAHLVFEKMLTPELKKKWTELLKKTIKKQTSQQPKQNKPALDQNDEELFCMAYASVYIHNAPITYTNEEWHNFIKKLP